MYRRDPAAIEAAGLRSNGGTVDATIEHTRVERRAPRQRIGARNWVRLAPGDADIGDILNEGFAVVEFSLGPGGPLRKSIAVAKQQRNSVNGDEDKAACI